jgi:hypothetical protein
VLAQQLLSDPIVRIARLREFIAPNQWNDYDNSGVRYNSPDLRAILVGAKTSLKDRVQLFL